MTTISVYENRQETKPLSLSRAQILGEGLEAPNERETLAQPHPCGTPSPQYWNSSNVESLHKRRYKPFNLG
jgi:hypothetical protein